MRKSVVSPKTHERLPVNGELQNRRGDERVRASLAVDLGGATGVTRDVSASGIFFETDASFAIGSPINLAVDLDTPGGQMRFKCLGNIVRLEHHDGKVGVAVKIIESNLEPVA